ncbi:WecB/TagA/CpsF family glycosyltransferase, partial [Candidatus Gottesmanbacteria bacterium]|nr:WecB/TagA/CpsF family glycosyltransferase [Candidatus Gottesmanbacteria bacterium]
SSKFNVKGIEPLVIFTPNPEIINYAQKDQYFKQIVNSAQINIPDGAGLCFAMEKKFHLKIPRLSGTDLMLDMCDMSSNNRFTIGLIGGRKGVALETKERLLIKYPKLKIEVLTAPEVILVKKYVGASIKYIGNKKSHSQNTKYLILNTSDKQDDKTERYFQDLVKEICNRKIDILFVALGFPKQEYFIKNIKDQISNIKYDKPLALMSVGGAFDYISGRVKRAPLWMRKNGLEWLFRLLQEPKRIIRMLRGSVFFYRIFTE